MKKVVSLFIIFSVLLTALSLVGCQSNEKIHNKNQPTQTVVELTENNYWKYIDLQFSGNGNKAGEDGSIFCTINGVLDFALYDDVVIAFDVIYYTDDQSDDEYNRYTMFIALNAAGNAEFETTHSGTTNVEYGKWNGIDGELVYLHDYNRKIVVKSITGKVIYTV